MAKGVSPLKTLRSREREKRKGDTLSLIKATEFLPEESTDKNDTVSGLSENDSSPPASQTTIEADITLDAEVIEKDDDDQDDPAPLVIDGTIPAAAPPTVAPSPQTSTRTRLPDYIPADGMDIWNVAKTHLDRILKNDIHREAALKKVIEYCQKRINDGK